jgi:hypothetical protein
MKEIKRVRNDELLMGPENPLPYQEQHPRCDSWNGAQI